MSNLDPISVTTAILAVFFGEHLAQIIGPYAIIMLGSTLGAGWSLGAMEKTSRAKAATFFMRINLTAMLITVPLANGLGHWLSITDATILLTPVALAIGLVGNNWPKVFKAIGLKLWKGFWGWFDFIAKARKTKDGE